MNFILQAVNSSVVAYAADILSEPRRRELAELVMAWARSRAKGTGPDVDAKMVELELRVKRLLMGIEVQVNEGGELVLKPRGSDEVTLTFLRLGSRWFYGSEEVVSLILGGVFNSKPA